MDSRVIATLKEWMSQRDGAAWLQAHPEHQATLAPYLDLDNTLGSSARAQCAASGPSNAAMGVGRSRLLNEVKASFNGSGPQAITRRGWAAPRAAMMAAVALAALGTVFGASAALGGGGLGQAVLDAVSGPSQEEGGINNAPDDADNGRANADDNAFEGSGNADDGAANGNDAGGTCEPGEADSVDDNANENAAERCDNAPDGIDNAGDNPQGGPPATPPVQGDNAQGDNAPGDNTQGDQQ